jgi:hypothetical protein
MNFLWRRIVSAMAILSKVIIVIMLVLILFSLGSALYFLMTERDNSERMVKALTWRIGLSILLFLFLLFAFAMGWITPHQV